MKKSICAWGLKVFSSSKKCSRFSIKKGHTWYALCAFEDAWLASLGLYIFLYETTKMYHQIGEQAPQGNFSFSGSSCNKLEHDSKKHVCLTFSIVHHIHNKRKPTLYLMTTNENTKEVWCVWAYRFLWQWLGEFIQNFRFTWRTRRVE